MILKKVRQNFLKIEQLAEDFVWNIQIQSFSCSIFLGFWTGFGDLPAFYFTKNTKPLPSENIEKPGVFYYFQKLQVFCCSQKPLKSPYSFLIREIKGQINSVFWPFLDRESYVYRTNNNNSLNAKETNELICIADQLIGFCMITTLAINELMSFVMRNCYVEKCHFACT